MISWYNTGTPFGKHGMTITDLEGQPRATDVAVTDESLVVRLDDGRVVSVPFEWYPRLLHGLPEERARHRLSPGGYGIHWPDLDEDISVESLLKGGRSRESDTSFRRWLASRSPPRSV